MKNRIYFLCLIFIMLLITIINETKFPYFIFIMLSITFFYSFYSVKKAKEKVYGYFWVSDKKTVVGDILKLRYKILYNGLNPIFYIMIKYKISKRLGEMEFLPEISFLRPFGTIYFYREFKVKHRGYYKLGEVNITLRDFFNMFYEEIKINSDLDIIVYPRFKKLDKFNINQSDNFGKTNVKNLFYQDYTNISMIKDYKEGDNIKFINWKLSAKYDDLKVIEYELTVKKSVFIFLDGSKNSFDIDKDYYDELIVEVAASIINYSLSQNIPTTLITNDDKRVIVSGNDISKFDNFLNELITFNVYGETSFNDFIDIEMRKLTSFATIVLIATKIDYELKSKIINLKKKRFIPILVIVSKDYKVSNEVNELRRLGIYSYVIDSFDSIKDVLEGGN